MNRKNFLKKLCKKEVFEIFLVHLFLKIETKKESNRKFLVEGQNFPIVIYFYNIYAFHHPKIFVHFNKKHFVKKCSVFAIVLSDLALKQK